MTSTPVIICVRLSDWALKSVVVSFGWETGKSSSWMN